MKYEAVIGLEIHAELGTASKMFCACPVVDPTRVTPNIAVCPVCAGMPGTLPVVNQRAVEYAIRVALALECQVNLTSIFARKNYFYPDLPKGYQISQYEQPLARNGRLVIFTSQGEKVIRVRRVHLEEDTGKLSHVQRDGEDFSLVDLNRAGVPLLEIVSEPDLRTAEEVRAYAVALRALMRYLGVNSGDMQKGVLRIEPNISVRHSGNPTLGTRTEIKNLNSFRALERATAYEIQRQSQLLENGGEVRQETRGWDESKGVTVTQRLKEGEDDYRYFPEPDLPPLVLEAAWVEQIRQSLPELPAQKLERFQMQFALSAYDAGVLIEEPEIAAYFEASVQAEPDTPSKILANWIIGDLFSLLNQAGQEISQSRVTPALLAELVRLVRQGEINQNTGKTVLNEMFESGETALEIITRKGLRQVSSSVLIANWVKQVINENPEQVNTYLFGKESVARWLFGQVMRLAAGQANPQVVQQELDRQLGALKST